MSNSLINEKSPYLQKAAQQPVAWFAWSESAFDKAKRENKPILLAIGAMWCHWCHVMDRESYNHRELASLINENFVPIKIDRDERPEIDRRYQAAMTALAGEAGWPLTAFLTPEGDLFAGGTYFPPEPRSGQRGFRQLLQEVAETYKTAGSSAQNAADEIRKLQQQAMPPCEKLSPDMIGHSVRELARDFDFVHGAFGEGARFPHPCALEFLMSAFFRSKDNNLESIIRTSLNRMEQGGIHDQLGGGFHRYSAGPDWNSPHFEKMLSDNAQLLRLYAQAFSLFQQPTYRETAEGILKWASETLSLPGGGFMHSQDADIGSDEEGGCYTWTIDELLQFLTEKELQVIKEYYSIRNSDGPNTPYNERALEDISRDLNTSPSLAGALLAAAKEKLYWRRKKRVQPLVDPTVYTGANALMISACWEAGSILKMEAPIEMAQRVLNQLMKHAWTGQFFGRTADINAGQFPGLLEDQVYSGIAMLDAFLLTANPQYLNLCAKIAETLASHFEDPETGGFFDISKQNQMPGNFQPTKPFLDSPGPGANPAAAIFLTRLHSVTGDDSYRQMAERTLQAFGETAPGSGAFAGGYYLALQQYLEGAFEIYVVGETDHPEADALRQTAWQTYRPRKEVRRLSPDASLPDPATQGMIDFIRKKRKPMAFVCVDGGCAAPVQTNAELRNLILTFNL